MAPLLSTSPHHDNTHTDRMRRHLGYLPTTMFRRVRSARHVGYASLTLLTVWLFFAQFRSPPWPENAKVILLWNELWDDPLFYLGADGVAPFRDCEASNCTVTADRRYVTYAAAVVFHVLGGDPASVHTDPPAYRYPGQLYVQVDLEPPTLWPLKHNVVDDIFNLTMTYRQDSDIVWPYFRVVRRADRLPGRYVSPTPASRRPRDVAWIASNCETDSRRERYVAGLAKYIDVDVYGACGEQTYPKAQIDTKYQELALTHKFYLSFENSFCEDYVTEKLRLPLEYDLLPVVLGATNYSRDAPPHSVLDIQSFPSPRALADRLHQLAQDDLAYSDYFQWRQTHEVQLVDPHEPFCELCKILHNPTFHRRYTGFRDWWNGVCDNSVIPRLEAMWSGFK